MKSINRFIYGPSPEEKVREWQRKLRQEERSLEREVLHVSAWIWFSSLYKRFSLGADGGQTRAIGLAHHGLHVACCPRGPQRSAQAIA